MKGYPIELQLLHDNEFNAVLVAINNVFAKAREKGINPNDVDPEGKNWEAFYHIGLYMYDKDFFMKQITFFNELLTKKYGV